MASEPKELQNPLREELKFVEGGGYKRCERFPWRPAFIFQDSSICPNRDAKQPIISCSECPLARFVPEEFRNCEYACRYIPLNAEGETVDSLYRSGTEGELETALKEWLRTVISDLERELGRGMAQN